MTFSMVYMNHTNVVVADGTITAETPDAFQALLDTNPFDGFRFVMALNSDGGNLIGGLRLGQMIRDAKLDTAVETYRIDPSTGKPGYTSTPGACMSACALAFLGGVRRNVDETSRLGFHQFSSAGQSAEAQDSVYLTEATTQLIGATILGYIMKMGADPSLYARLSEALPHEMWEPRGQELSALKIVTREKFQDFQFEPYGSGAIAFAVLKENIVGRSVVGQVTAYCKDRTPYLLLSGVEGERSLEEWTRKTIDEMQSGYRIDGEGGAPGVNYGRNAVSVRTKEGLPIVELRMDAEGAALFSKRPVLVSVDFPAAAGAMIYLRTDPTEADRAALDAAFRLCIR